MAESTLIVDSVYSTATISRPLG